MIITKIRYPLHFFVGDFDLLVLAPEDSYFEDNKGKVYAQYYKGQPISQEVFDGVYGYLEVPKSIEFQEQIENKMEHISELIQEVVEEEKVVGIIAELEAEQIQEVQEFQLEEFEEVQSKPEEIELVQLEVKEVVEEVRESPRSKAKAKKK